MSLYIGIDPAPVLQHTACLLIDPNMKQTRMLSIPSLLNPDVLKTVKAVGIEMPISRGAGSGFSSVWNMHQNAVILATMLVMLGALVYATDANVIRSQVCGWPLRDGRGKIIKGTFDPWWYRELPNRGWIVGKGTVLGQSGKPWVDRRDALAAGLFTTSHPTLIKQYLWELP